MKNKVLLVTLLLLLVLISAACGAQDTTDEPGQVTAMPTVSTDEGTATEEAGEVETTPTGAVEGGTATQGTEATDATPTVSTDSGTAAPETGGTAGIPETGPGDAGLPDDLNELIRVLRTTGATVELGDVVNQDFSSVPGQILRINGEEVQIFTYASAEELEAQASQLADDGDPEDEPQFYKLGNMLVRYAGTDTSVRDLLEDVLGAQAAGQ